MSSLKVRQFGCGKHRYVWCEEKFRFNKRIGGACGSHFLNSKCGSDLWVPLFEFKMWGLPDLGCGLSTDVHA
jgi:hypothetical protein